MATDPVQQIRELEHDTPLAMDLKATLARLAALPPSSEAPYLTVRSGSQRGPKAEGISTALVKREIAGSKGIGPLGAFFPLARLSSRILPRFASRADRSEPPTVCLDSGNCQSAQVEAVQAEAGNRTVRELAAEFGVSHETIRTALRLETLSTAACDRL